MQFLADRFLVNIGPQRRTEKSSQSGRCDAPEMPDSARSFGRQCFLLSAALARSERDKKANANGRCYRRASVTFYNFLRLLRCLCSAGRYDNNRKLLRRYSPRNIPFAHSSAVVALCSVAQFRVLNCFFFVVVYRCQLSRSHSPSPGDGVSGKWYALISGRRKRSLLSEKKIWESFYGRPNPIRRKKKAYDAKASTVATRPHRIDTSIRASVSNARAARETGISCIIALCGDVACRQSIEYTKSPRRLRFRCYCLVRTKSIGGGWLCRRAHDRESVPKMTSNARRTHRRSPRNVAGERCGAEGNNAHP